jgi:hypothetical protein
VSNGKHVKKYVLGFLSMTRLFRYLKGALRWMRHMGMTFEC